MDKVVVFGFSRPIKFKFFAYLIQRSEGINYNHGYCKFLGDSTNFIYQATGHGTNFKSQNSFDKENISVEEYAFDIPKQHYDALLKYCADREGLKYGVFQVIGKAIVQVVFVLSGRTIKIKNPFTDDLDCIEELSNILSKALKDVYGDEPITNPIDMNTSLVKPFRDWIASLPQLKKVK